MKKIFLFLLLLLSASPVLAGAGPGQGGVGPSPPPVGTLGQLNIGKSVGNAGSGQGEMLQQGQSATGASIAYGTADLQRVTFRSNAGSAMTDTFPAAGTTGLVNGALINVYNGDASGADTITAGAGTTIRNYNGSSVSTVVIGAGRDVWFTFNVSLQQWSPILNTATSLLAFNNLSDLLNAATARANLGLGTASTHDVTFFAQVANNLSDLANASTARTNLGLGTAATEPISFFLQASNNLSDLPNATTARTNLGLGSAATQSSAFFLQAANNLSDLGSASTARTNLGLGTAAVANTGTSGANVPFLNGANTWSAAQTISSLLLVTQVQETAQQLASGSCTGTVNIDLTTGTYFYCTVTGTTTFTVSNPAPSGKVSSFVLELTNGTGKVVNYMSGTTWPSAVAPTLSGNVDLEVFSTRDGATTWRGVLSEANSH